MYVHLCVLQACTRWWSSCCPSAWSCWCSAGSLDLSVRWPAAPTCWLDLHPTFFSAVLSTQICLFSEPVAIVCDYFVGWPEANPLLCYVSVKGKVGGWCIIHTHRCPCVLATLENLENSFQQPPLTSDSLLTSGNCQNLILASLDFSSRLKQNGRPQ